MKLEDLRKDLLDMSLDERRQFIMRVRASRRVRKESTKARREKAQQPNRMLTMFQALSAEEQAVFLQQLSRGVDADN